MNKLDLQMCSQNRNSHVGDSLTEIIENRVDLEKIDMTSSQKEKKISGIPRLSGVLLNLQASKR